MAAIDVIIFAAAAGFAFAVLITVVVIVGIRKEERYLTLMDRNAPGAMAQLTRIVLGRYVRREQVGSMTSRLPAEPGSTLERMTSSRS
jgi:hypothetical protein